MDLFLQIIACLIGGGLAELLVYLYKKDQEGWETAMIMVWKNKSYHVKKKNGKYCYYVNSFFPISKEKFYKEVAKTKVPMIPIFG